jgi:cation diffusion facilitator family transporter
VLNVGVAIAKLAFGYATGAISIISDGFHSLTDGASNVMGLVAMRAARKPPDEDHPYGHRKYKTLAAAASSSSCCSSSSRWCRTRSAA